MIAASSTSSSDRQPNFTETHSALLQPCQLVPAGAASARFAPAFASLQAAIEALDRAIKDEEQLPPDYAQEEAVAPEAWEAHAGDGSNVVDVDFDPA